MHELGGDQRPVYVVRRGPGRRTVNDPPRLGTRLFDACIAILLGALALYGAVLLVQAIWPWLLGLAVIVVGALLWSLRQRRW